MALGVVAVPYCCASTCLYVQGMNIVGVWAHFPLLIPSILKWDSPDPRWFWRIMTSEYGLAVYGHQYVCQIMSTLPIRWRAFGRTDGEGTEGCGCLMSPIFRVCQVSGAFTGVFTNMLMQNLLVEKEGFWKEIQFFCFCHPTEPFRHNNEIGVTHSVISDELEELDYTGTRSNGSYDRRARCASPWQALDEALPGLEESLYDNFHLQGLVPTTSERVTHPRVHQTSPFGLLRLPDDNGQRCRQPAPRCWRAPQTVTHASATGPESGQTNEYFMPTDHALYMRAEWTEGLALRRTSGQPTTRCDVVLAYTQEVNTPYYLFKNPSPEGLPHPQPNKGPLQSLQDRVTGGCIPTLASIHLSTSEGYKWLLLEFTRHPQGTNGASALTKSGHLRGVGSSHRRVQHATFQNELHNAWLLHVGTRSFVIKVSTKAMDAKNEMTQGVAPISSSWERRQIGDIT
ncbi:hypothetical protein BS47DRAFT_1367594 [Hydnum rufescens UP504]|uniref:Uncharacterized protein n=1 Tax=Hydnum rufescens UP504 TaxID=1448309 RepID=A0A9P6DLP9_9AGAM|nr:hypothetical protein BS47DRAFT_1367594 [Hydnum rufescens UP504]